MTWKKKTNEDYPAITEREIDNLIHAHRSGLLHAELLSMDEPVLANTGNVNDSVRSDFVVSKNDSIEDLIDQQAVSNAVNELLKRLREREADIIRYRFGLKPMPSDIEDAKQLPKDLDVSLNQISKVYGLSRERVRQIEEGALKKMHDWAVRGGRKQYYTRLLHG